MSRLAAIRLLAMDVDGVLTDGKMTYGPSGEIKSFDVQDGLGITLAINAGLDIAWVTGNISEVVAARAATLGVTEAHQGCRCKSDALKDIARRRSLAPEQIAYIADDLNDIPAIEFAGVSFAVADAASDVKAKADYVTQRRGGEGAVREVIESILAAQGRWGEAVSLFLDMLRAEQDTDQPPAATS